VTKKGENMQKKLNSTINPQQYFSRIENPKIQRSVFDRSHGYKTTLDNGDLIPVYIDEALPGDTFDMRATMFGRLGTPLKPIMDNIHFDLHFFSVPYRLLWSNWNKFMGEQDDPGDSTDYTIPTTTAPASGGHAELSLADYMGIPTKIASLEHSALPLRAYNLIYNEWYRDQNLNDSVAKNVGDGPDTITDYSILKRNKRKDYFTSALPWAQKGTAVDLPLGTTAPVQSDGNQIKLNDGTNSAGMLWQAADTSLTAGTWSPGSPGNGAAMKFGTTADVTATGLQADLSSATAATINELRQAFQIQKMYERDARGGTRYIEMIKAHFGVTSPDFRLQRPEFLGGGSVPVNILPVANTSEDATNKQGELTGVGTFSVNNNGFTKSFTEHEIVMGIVSVRADMTYQQGLNKMWSRSTRFDFYWPSFAHLGEQSILNKEIYAQNDANDDLVFGYQERYAEYRYKPSQVTGLYRSNATASLDLWHLAQEFSALPSLNASFIQEAPPIDRIIAVTSEPEFLLDCFFDLKCTRPMPTFSTPGLIDHF
jgi:hypothetical protein